jgi:predicted nuclease of predicted toxin-antitoxin system
MLKFIVDTQLPPKLAYALNDWGANAIHTTYFEDGHLLDDGAIRKIAVAESRIVVTKDADFRDYFFLKGSPPNVLLIKTGNILNKDLIILLQSNFQAISKLFEEGNHMVVVDRQSITAY